MGSGQWPSQQRLKCYAAAIDTDTLHPAAMRGLLLPPAAAQQQQQPCWPGAVVITALAVAWLRAVPQAEARRSAKRSAGSAGLQAFLKT